MKKHLFLILLTISLTAQAQNKTDDIETESQKSMTEFSKAKRHSVSLDVMAGLVVPSFNPRYEYILSKYSAIGADLNINLDDENGAETLEKFSFSPFYRQYFFSKEDYGAKGFYGEGFFKFYTYENDIHFYYGDVNTNWVAKTYFETSIGIGLGWKWVSYSGFFIDTNVGLGRNLGFTDDPYKEEFTGKFGVNFGWQF
ncbi:MAG: hypothetical protein ACPIA1_04655 [Flavobacteriaceae bacterium]